MCRRVLFLLFFFVSSTALLAQKVNSDGKKMVSRIVYEKFDSKGRQYRTKTYFFKYDTDKKLSLVEYYDRGYSNNPRKCVSTDKIVITRVGDTIKRTDFSDGKEDFTSKYSYKLENGVIVSRNEISQEDNYGYITNVKSDYYYWEGRLREIALRWFSKCENDKKFVPSSEKYHYLISNWDGRPFSASKNYEREEYTDYINDTNVNLHVFAWNKAGRIAIYDDYIELLTEWLPFKSDKLISCSGKTDSPCWGYYTVLYKFDLLHNLSEMRIVSSNTKKIIGIVNIEYVK